MPEQNPSPHGSRETAARVAIALSDIDKRDKGYFDVLLADFLRVCWPTVRNQAQ
jgi:hypothetical protein